MAKAMLPANRAASQQANTPSTVVCFAESVEIQPADSVLHPSWCARATRDDVLTAAKGRILGVGETVGTYQQTVPPPEIKKGPEGPDRCPRPGNSVKLRFLAQGLEGRSDLFEAKRLFKQWCDFEALGQPIRTKPSGEQERHAQLNEAIGHRVGL